jgi:hypothetical protein
MFLARDQLSPNQATRVSKIHHYGLMLENCRGYRMPDAASGCNKNGRRSRKGVTAKFWDPKRRRESQAR